MSDGSFLQWPFFSDEHRELAARLDEWANRHIPSLTSEEHPGPMMALRGTELAVSSA